MSAESQSIYFLGRPVRKLQNPYSGVDQTYCTERHDDKRIDSANFQHCTFANLGFKGTIFKNAQFLDCAFVNCYFRRSELSNCKFTGCRFIDCNLDRIVIKHCDFQYSHFRDCHIAYSEMKYSLPRPPNLREVLCRNLAVETWRLGLSLEAKQYRIAELQAREEHLRAAALHESQWYEEHFKGWRRVSASVNWAFSVVNRWLWGYGQRSLRLLMWALILPVFVFPALFWAFIDHLSHRTRSDISLPDLIVFSLMNFIPTRLTADVIPTSVCTQLIAGLESLVGIIIAGLLAAYIFRWMLYR